jgi:ribonuclease HI
MAEGGSRPAEAIVRGREERFKARVLKRPAPLPPGPLRTSQKSTALEAIRTIRERCIDRMGLGAVEEVCPRFSWKTKGQIIIERTDLAEETARRWGDLGATCLWTDGSQLPDGHTGAAVAWNVDGRYDSQEFYLGTNKEVFDAEVLAICEALDIALRRQKDGLLGDTLVIFTDAQAALSRLRNDDEGPGQQLAHRAFNIESALGRRGIRIECRWVPSHVGIPGNEAADAAAKRAASHRCANPDHCERAVCTQVEWTSLAHINRLATETQSRITKEWIQDKLKDSRSSNIDRCALQRENPYIRP